MRNAAHLFLGLVLGCAGLPSLASPDSDNSMQTAQRLEREMTTTVRLDYLLFLPRDYDAQPGKQWPLMLFLHGAGERGDDVWKTEIHGPSKYFRKNPDFPFIVISPVCPAGQRWQNESLLALLDEVASKHRVDSRRIYLTGLSMGGFGTWALGVQHPEKFAAIAPICGGGQIIDVLLSGREKPDALRSLPVWAFHGAQDRVVPIEESERMVAALRRVEARDVKLTVYPEAGHDSWTETYNNPELYEWFLSHSR